MFSAIGSADLCPCFRTATGMMLAKLSQAILFYPFRSVMPTHKSATDLLFRIRIGVHSYVSLTDLLFRLWGMVFWASCHGAITSCLRKTTTIDGNGALLTLPLLSLPKLTR